MKVQSALKSGKYPIIIGIFFFVAVATSLVLNLARVQTRYVELATVMGRSLIQTHEVSRKWNSLHGGVYVPVTETFRPNPYLDDPRRDVTMTDGMKLTMINPAYMTRLISQLSEKEEGIRFRLASLKPLNPRNMANRLESEALSRFNLGEYEVSTLVRSGESTLFYYNAPLVMGESCRDCHGKGGPVSGEIGGVMTVSFSFAPFQKAIDQSVRAIHGGHILFFGIGIILILGAFVDTFRRMQAKETLSYQKSLLECQSEASIDGILVVSEKGEMISSNRRFMEMWGIPDEILATRSDMRALDFVRGKLLHPEEFTEKVAYLCEHPDERSRDEIHLKDGRVFDRYSAPVRGDGGVYYGRVWFFRDITVKVRSEREIREERDRAQKFLDVARVMIVALDDGGKISLINREGARVLGYREDELIGKNWFETCVPERIREDVYRVYQSLMRGETGIADRNENPVVTKGGEERIIAWSNTILLDGGGAITGTLSSGEDVTVRKRFEDRVMRNCETQDVLKRILQTSLLPVSLDSQLEQTLDLIFEYPWIVPIQKGCIFLVEDEPGVLVMKAQRGFIGDVLSTCRRVSFDTCLCGKAAATGTVQFCRCPDEAHEMNYHGMVPHSHYCVPVVSDDSLLGVLNIYLDAGHVQDSDEEEFLKAVASTLAGLISRKRAEDNLQHLATAVERAGEIILITDSQGKIQYVNPAFEQVTGYRKDEVIGENPRILASGKHDAAFYRDLWETIERGDVWRGRIVNRKKDGTLYHEETTISPGRDKSGKIVNYVAVKHDITNEVALENQLRHAQKMEAVGQLAGGVAHDFNNILTAIIGYASFLKMKMKKDDTLESYVTNILASAERAADLTQGLLAFSRKQVFKLEPLNINAAVGRVGSLLTRLIGEDVELITELSEGDLVVMADSGQVEQVLVNLATNSRDAMQGGGVFTIKTREVILDNEFERVHGYGKPGRYALVEATDTGSGMDKETLEKIFEPFFTKKEVGSGTGLGLAIVYGIIKQHGGYINVRSEPGQGTTFHIYLPLTEKDPKELKKQEPSIPLVGREKILVAEDDVVVRRLLKSVLEKFGYRVVEAVDGKDAVSKFMENPGDIDLLILDVVMPRKNGKEVYDELKRAGSDMKVLFMSGYAADIVFKKGLVEEGLKLISKPVSPSELLKNVREALDGQETEHR